MQRVIDRDRRANALREDFAARLHAHVQPKYRELWGLAQRPPREP